MRFRISEDIMGKVETVLKAEIARLSRRETRRLMTKHVEELRRLRRRVAELAGDVRALKAARAEEQVKTKFRTSYHQSGGTIAPSRRSKSSTKSV